MIREIQLTLKPEARAQALEAMRARQLPIPDHFEGPHFKAASDELGWTMSDKFVEVEVYDARFDSASYVKPRAVYLYPISDIARVKVVP